MRIVETDNYGSYYPDEKFLNIPRVENKVAIQLVNLLNEHACYHDRWWKIVDNDYQLQTEFKPKP